MGLVKWVHVGYDQPCWVCDTLDGGIFQETSLGMLIPPLHPKCHCHLEQVVIVEGRPVPKTTEIDFDNLPEGCLAALVRYVAWMLRVGMTVPPVFAALRAAAEAYNRERGEAGG